MIAAAEVSLLINFFALFFRASESDRVVCARPIYFAPAFCFEAEVFFNSFDAAVAVFELVCAIAYTTCLIV